MGDNNWGDNNLDNMEKHSEKHRKIRVIDLSMNQSNISTNTLINKYRLMEDNKETDNLQTNFWTS